MKPISDYNDYRLFIRDYYEERKLMTGLSWRGFNKMAGYANTRFLKLVCDGKSKLSSVGASRLAKLMGLSKIQTSYQMPAARADALDGMRRRAGLAETTIGRSGVHRGGPGVEPPVFGAIGRVVVIAP